LNSLQELPAAYAIADLNRVLTYAGDRPFSGDSLTEVPRTSVPQNWEGTEHWAACVNAQNFGFGVYNPEATNFYGWLYGYAQGGPLDKSMCYVSPHGWEALTKTSTYSYKYFLIVGTVDQIRQEVYVRDPRLSARSDSEQTWGFDVDGDFNGWTPSATITPVSVVTAALRGTATTSNPYVVGPAMTKSASALKKVVVRLRNNTAGRRARLCFRTSISADWSRSLCQTVAIRPYSDFTEYTFDMSGMPDWTGTVTGLLFRPTDATGRFGIDWIRIAA
jgi:hypothetical protein